MRLPQAACPGETCCRELGWDAGYSGTAEEAIMQTCTSGQDQSNSPTYACYRRALLRLQEAEAPFLVGGSYAFERYTGIARHTKDFDLFVRPADAEPVLAALAAADFQTELTYPHWLGKAFSGDDVIDIIFSSGNGVARVDDEWFAHAGTGTVLGMEVPLCPAEEMIWSKAYVMERERYDGADIAHLLHAAGPNLDWPRLLRRFAGDWRVLFSYLVLFGFIYPFARERIPAGVMHELLGRLQDELGSPAPTDRVCRGTLLSREQFLVDLDCLGYQDGRLFPRATMTPEQIEHWTAAIEHRPTD
jgi:hypothetical protein